MSATRALPPGPRIPPVAQTVRWVVRPTAFMEACARRYGDVFTVRLVDSPPMVFVSDPELLRAVFTADPDQLLGGVANGLLEPVLGANSLLLLDGPRHLRQRRLMLPPFHGERMARHEETMTAVAEREIATWPLDTPFQLIGRMQAATLEVIMRVVFGVHGGVRLERLRRRLRDLLAWASARRVLTFALLGPTRFGPRVLAELQRVLAPVHALLDEEIADRRAATGAAAAAGAAAPPATTTARDDAPATTPTARDDVFSLLLEARDEDGRPLRDEELRDELVTLLIAGHETTATALAWTVERLLRHPRVLARVREELDAGDGDAYLDAVAKESLRLRPIVPIVARHVAAPFALGDRVVPAGVELAPCIYLTHRRADVYPDPLAFRPERFLGDPAGTYTWIPFGGGTRRCLGASFAQLELRAVLRAIVRATELRPSRPEPERIRRRAITYTPHRGAEVVATRRRGHPADRRTGLAAA